MTPYRAAIEAPVGPTLVLAGPGAGKTFCLISRIAHLIESEGTAADRICTVTFTNKAAEEVGARLARKLGPEAGDITCGTLHSLCLGVLRDHAEAAGLRRGFGVADADYQKLLLLRLGIRDPREQTRLLNAFGQRLLADHELSERDEATFENYVAGLREKNLVDFDDLISLTAALLRSKAEAADEVSSRWSHLLVDEFQDLDASQYAIIKRLAWGHQSIFAVGDEEQSIFGWRGSNPAILWRFMNDFGVKEPIQLDRNFRCSRQIFDAARRLMRENPNLFEKRIRAERESQFEVEVVEFEDDSAEADWLVNHLMAARLSHEVGWGDFAVLYRRHVIGSRIEDRLVAAGIPCRLARGQSLLDDKVIAYVIASLRLMDAPDDPLALESFAERMLPRQFLAEMRARASSWGVELLAALRRFARASPPEHPDKKKAWRFIYHVENLRALYRSHDDLALLVERLLSERIGKYGNALEEHHDELGDPAALAAAVNLAEKIKTAVAGGRSIRIPPRGAGGAEIALRGMLEAAKIPASVAYCGDAEAVGAGDILLDGEGCPSVLTLFKALQLIYSGEFREVFEDYVTFDLETTDHDPRSCEIIEIGAARVRNGTIVETYQSLVRPQGPITAKATAVHGYSDAHVADARSLEDVWPEFRQFVGDDILIAHNGFRFDVPVLCRLVGAFAATDDLVFFDTLPLARSLFAGSAKLAALAERFDVELPRAHHALDDAIALAGVFKALSQQRLVRARKAALANLLDFLAIGLVLEADEASSSEAKLLLEIARPYALGRYSDCLEYYAAERAELPEAAGPPVEEIIERLGGQKLMDRIRAERSPGERYPAAFARLSALVEASTATTLEASIAALLARVALSTSSEGVEADSHRVNLLTLHAAKGLEFAHVYVVGVEDYELPGWHAMEENIASEIEEARRLLYVGMTRAKDRLILTRCVRRGGRLSGERMFLEEIGLVQRPSNTRLPSPR